MPIIKKKEKFIFINQDDPVFDGSSYQEDNFVVGMHNVGIAAKIKNESGRKIAQAKWEEMGGEGDAPDEILGKFIILEEIDTWSGFFNEGGTEAECTLENKSDMYDYDVTLFNLLFKAYQKAIGATDEELQESDVIDDAVGKPEDTSNGTIQAQGESLEQTSAEIAEDQ